MHIQSKIVWNDLKDFFCQQLFTKVLNIKKYEFYIITVKT